MCVTGGITKKVNHGGFGGKNACIASREVISDHLAPLEQILTYRPCPFGLLLFLDLDSEAGCSKIVGPSFCLAALFNSIDGNSLVH